MVGALASIPVERYGWSHRKGNPLFSNEFPIIDKTNCYLAYELKKDIEGTANGT